MATFSIRLDDKTTSALGRLAAQTGKTKTEIVREALQAYVDKVDAENAAKTPYELAKHLIGSLDSGGMQLSVDGGKKVAQMLLEERDARRRADRRRATRRAAR
jgi:RHH-type rel operon transcriptional repressor/antitoxin RelB